MKKYSIEELLDICNNFESFGCWVYSENDEMLYEDPGYEGESYYEVADFIMTNRGHHMAFAANNISYLARELLEYKRKDGK